MNADERAICDLILKEDEALRVIEKADKASATAIETKRRSRVKIVEAGWLIGERLTKLRPNVPNRKWKPYVKTTFNRSDQWANDRMRITAGFKRDEAVDSGRTLKGLLALLKRKPVAVDTDRAEIDAVWGQQVEIAQVPVPVPKWTHKHGTQNVTIYQGDAEKALLLCEAESFDACMCDPPYGFTAWTHRETQSWERAGVPSTGLWGQVFRVLRPGALLMAATGAKTYHLIASGIEKAGFKIKDPFLWIYTQASATGVREGHRLKPATEPYVVAVKPPDVGRSLTYDPTRYMDEALISAMMEKLGEDRDTFLANMKAMWEAMYFHNKATKTERTKFVNHPTLKPLALTEHLSHLLLYPGAKDFLIPFSGAASEIIGAMRAGWPNVTGVEMEAKYVEQARRRIIDLVDGHVGRAKRSPKQIVKRLTSG